MGSSNGRELNVKKFTLNHPIGKGSLGKVWKVTQKSSSEVSALKIIYKKRAIARKSESLLITEFNTLILLKHSFIVNLKYAFQDKDSLYLGLEYMSGGDLRYHLNRKTRFDETQVRFMVACLLLAIEYVHFNNMLHRDIKPENLVLGGDGYLRLTDFGSSLTLPASEQSIVVGTPGYIAPEILCRENYGFPSDYFSIGVLVFELMTGTKPYRGKDWKEIRALMLREQVQVHKNILPKGWSIEAADFCNKLIQVNPSNRLGWNGPNEVQSHAWLRYFPWNSLWDRSLQSPVMFEGENNFDNEHARAPWNDRHDILKVKEPVKWIQGYYSAESNDLSDHNFNLHP